MRSAIRIVLAISAFAITPARTQGTWLETRMTRAICSGGVTPVANTDGLAKRLKLTDPQKALADFREGFFVAGTAMVNDPRYGSDETNLNATKPIFAFDANVRKRMPATLFATTRRDRRMT